MLEMNAHKLKSKIKNLEIAILEMAPSMNYTEQH